MDDRNRDIMIGVVGIIVVVIITALFLIAQNTPSQMPEAFKKSEYSYADEHPEVYPYSVITSGNGTFFCKEMDEENRVGHECVGTWQRAYAEYHLSMMDSWAKRTGGGK